MIDQRLIDEVVQRIVERFHPRKVVVFGSHARGDADPGSDLDLFIEMETPLRPPQRAVEVSRLFGLHPWPMDIIVYTPDEAARMRQDPASFINVIEGEGKVLYERTRAGVRSVVGEGSERRPEHREQPRI